MLNVKNNDKTDKKNTDFFFFFFKSRMENLPSPSSFHRDRLLSKSCGPGSVKRKRKNGAVNKIWSVRGYASDPSRRRLKFSDWTLYMWTKKLGLSGALDVSNDTKGPSAPAVRSLNSTLCSDLNLNCFKCAVQRQSYRKYAKICCSNVNKRNKKTTVSISLQCLYSKVLRSTVDTVSQTQE